MALLVLAYLKLARKDFVFIQSLRRRQDQLYHSVKPHFTIVFPVSIVDSRALCHHVRKHCRTRKKFSFVLCYAVTNKDPFSEYTHVFLVPEKGYRNIARLHDCLYTGIIANELRPDIPFIPHVAVANAVDPRPCKALADSLTASQIEIPGAVEELTVVDFVESRVRYVDTVPLS